MNPLELNNSDLDILTHHISNVSNNTLNLSHNRLSSLSITYIAYFYHVFPLHVNTFQQLFLNWTRPEVEQLKTAITDFHKFNGFVNSISLSLSTLMVYLGYMAYVIFFYILNLLSFIYGFNLLQTQYILSVMRNLLYFTYYIKLMLLSTSKYIHTLIDILVLFFCDVINAIFKRIKSKLLYYLTLVEFQIYLDYILLSFDLDSIIKLIRNLESEVRKYILISQTVNQLLKTLKKLPSQIQKLQKVNKKLKSHDKKLKKIIPIINVSITIIDKLTHKFYYLNNIISKTMGLLSSLELDKYIQSLESKYDDLLIHLKNNLPKLITHSSTIMNMGFDRTTTLKFQKTVKSIKNLLVLFDIPVLKKIISIVGQLYMVEEIKIDKLNELIHKIENLYWNLSSRGTILFSTINFYQETKPTISGLCKSLEFSCSDVNQFLKSCCQVEEKALSISQKISECIKNLAGVCIQSKCLGVPTTLLESYVTLLEVILYLKFYVDLIIREMLIFKSIIDNLIVMSVSSSFLDPLISKILEINTVDSGIGTLMAVDVYLRAFYFIQLENTIVIFGLSSNLLFSEFIHDEYHVLLFNLQSINILIWMIECYINQLIVFRHVTTSLNSVISHITLQFMAIVQISSVTSSMATISDKLWSITNSMSKLNEIQQSLTIKSWKQSAEGVMKEIKLLNDNIRHIDSKLSNITLTLKSMLLLQTKLASLYYYLFFVMSRVYSYIKLTNKSKLIGAGIGNKYYAGVISSVMGPCNKILMFIFGYLFVMWANIVALINIIENIIKLIEVKLETLSLLTKLLITHIENIVERMMEVECAIEAVVRNTIRCSLKSLIKDFKKSPHVDRGGVNEHNHLLINYSLVNITNYKSLIDRLYEMIEKTDGILSILDRFQYCQCLTHYNRETKSDIRLSHGFKFSHEYSHSNFHLKPVMPNYGNHFCLCIVINYILYPRLATAMCNLVDSDLDTLSTTSRKYDKYLDFNWINSDTLKGLIMLIDLIEVISKMINQKLTCSCKDLMCKCVKRSESRGVSQSSSSISDNINYGLNEAKKWFRLFESIVNVGYNITHPFHQGVVPNIFRCYCMYSNNKWYKSIVSITLYLSSLIENIWDMDPQKLTMGIHSFSELRWESESEIDNLKVYIRYLLKINSQLTKSLKSYFTAYSTFISNHYNQFHKSLIQNIKTFECIQSCVNEMLKQLKGDDGSKGFVKREFSYISDSFVKTTISLINSNYASNIITKINPYLSHLDNSNEVSMAVGLLNNVKSILSEFSGYIDQYTKRITPNLINPLYRLKKIESNILTLSSISEKYESIKDAIERCKSSLEFDVQRLELISSNVKMIVSCLDTIIGTLTNFKSTKEELEKFKQKCQNPCVCSNKKCKICVCGKVIYVSLSIIIKTLRYVSKSIHIPLIMDCLRLTEKLKIQYVRSSWINSNIKILKTLKNNYSTHFNAYSDHKNIANSFPRPTMGYAYDTVQKLQENSKILHTNNNYCLY